MNTNESIKLAVIERNFIKGFISPEQIDWLIREYKEMLDKDYSQFKFEETLHKEIKRLKEKSGEGDVF